MPIRNNKPADHPIPPRKGPPAILQKSKRAVGSGAKRSVRQEVNALRELLGWVREQILEIEDDERFHYKPALVHVNAPLALIQTALLARHGVLKEIEKKLYDATD